MLNQTICFTGHRKIRGQYINDLRNNPIFNALSAAIQRAASAGYTTFISGGALGVDQVAARAVLDLGLKLIIARPFPSQASKWISKSVQEFGDICRQAAQVVDVSPDPYSPAKMQIRNQWMVDNSVIVIAVFDGNSGGTANCVKYAQSKGKSILVINPDTLTETWI